MTCERHKWELETECVPCALEKVPLYTPKPGDRFLTQAEIDEIFGNIKFTVEHIKKEKASK